ncbi:MAG TPA: oligopeptide/dipeptide ABC transporter ATP-binding protein [Thermoanaerobaculia bacterium]|nr:oligopeptide/dipeptide ABC transporter ATP-binding protein [Thermoanaerobaculia bacterium]
MPGEPPSAVDPPPGCRFHPRCPIARPRCAAEAPALARIEPGRRVACFYPGEMG